MALLFVKLAVLFLLAVSFMAHAQVVSTQDACLAASTVQMPGIGDVVIDGTAGGVTILGANGKRCQAIIQNTGTAAMRCGPATITVSATVGFLVPPGQSLVTGVEGRELWKCIRTTGTSTSASIAEAITR